VTRQFEFGRKGEEKVAAVLRRAGARVQINPGSRGAEDLVATFSGGRKWLIQVKTSRGSNPKGLSSSAKHRLNTKAGIHNALPVLAQVDGKGDVEFRSTRSGRRLKPQR